ncbi:MAG TPA: S8 family serine peptidase [Thermoanaerobaculia bacterium]
MSFPCLKRIVGGVAIIAAMALLVPAAMSAQEEGPPGQERYLVEFHEWGAHAPASIRAAGGSVVFEFPDLRAVAAWLPAPAAEGLRHNPNVKLVEVDPPRYPLAQRIPYGIPMVQADQVSDAAAANRKICIIDSGYYRDHTDLPDAGITSSFNAGTGDPFTDRCGHGSHVAGTIAAINNTEGVVGVLPNQHINLHIVKVFGDDCLWTYTSNLINALNACRSAGANVVSMSLGGGAPSTTEQNAFNDAWNAGVLSVAAAGNDGNSAYSYPASYSTVISVAAIDSNKVVAGFSQKNDQVDLAAPGVSVESTVPYIDRNDLTVDGVTYSATWIENAARGSVTGSLVNGGRCTAPGSWSGNVVLCERGDTTFLAKVQNVQNGGGIGAAIYNNVPGGFNGTLGAGNTSTIPAIGLTQADGQFLVANKLGRLGELVSLSQSPASGYDFFSGTSMATPHVSGVAALVWSNFPTLTNAQIRDALESTTQDLGAAGRDNSYGWGLVQAKAAFDKLNGGPPPPPPSCTDADGDGYCSIATGGTDCNDNNARIRPGANDTKGRAGRNGVDDDCNGVIDG